MNKEPVFELRAQDRFAPALVRTWTILAKAAGVSKEKIVSAEKVLVEMQRWQKENPVKTPD